MRSASAGTPRCGESWIADSEEDPAVSIELREAFRRHAATCPACTRALGDAARVQQLASGLSAPQVDEFHHRRLRHELMSRAGGAGATGVARLMRPRLGLGLLALVVAVLAAHEMGRRDLLRASVRPPQFDVVALESAIWTNEESGPTTRLRLAAGAAVFHVRKLTAGQRFIVAMPDGEVEVRGTRFVVDVVEGRTAYVVVMEGKVAVRVAGRAERLLAAGERWESPERAAPASSPAGGSSPSSGTGPSSSGAGGTSRAGASSSGANAPPQLDPAKLPAPAPPTPASPSPPSPRHRTAPLARRIASRSGVSSAADTTPGARAPDPAVAPAAASAIFTRALQAFRAGRYHEADAGWAEFLAGFPGDGRAEDATFLRAVGRARAGDRKGAAAIARVYLERFPHGMRRQEAATLGRGDGDPAR